jgi:hypothetical protein
MVLQVLVLVQLVSLYLIVLLVLLDFKHFLIAMNVLQVVMEQIVLFVIVMQLELLLATKE